MMFPRVKPFWISDCLTLRVILEIMVFKLVHKAGFCRFLGKAKGN